MKQTIKMGICTLLILVIALTSSLTAFAAVAGDVNSDGRVNSTDALCILSHAVGITPTKFDKSSADLNADGRINSTDALIVLNIAVGLDVPSIMSKDAIIKLYNDGIVKSYDQNKCNLVISANVESTVNKILIDGEENPEFDKMFSDILGNTEYEDEKYTFYKGKTLSGDKAEDMLSPLYIYSDEIKTASCEKYGDGYKLIFRLIPHTEDMTDNNDMSEIFNFESYIAEYPDTVITAIVDGQGRISSIDAHIPANLKANASNSDFQLYMDVSLTQDTSYKFSY